MKFRPARKSSAPPLDHCIVYGNQQKEVAKADQTAAYKLFFYRYSVQVQQMFTIDVKVAQDWGVATSGNAQQDMEQRAAWVSIFPTPVEMISYLDRGAQLTFLNAAQAAEIYLTLLGHLQDWLKAVEFDPTLRRAPLEDLRKMDELAAAIFPYAWPQLQEHEDASGYGEWLTRVRKTRRSMAMTDQAKVDQPSRLGINPRYRTFSDRIAEKLERRNEFQ